MLLDAIWRYPVKSLQGEQLAEAVLDDSGRLGPSPAPKWANTARLAPLRSGVIASAQTDRQIRRQQPSTHSFGRAGQPQNAT